MQGDREFEELRKQTARATYERTLQDGDRAVAAGRFADAEKALQALIGTPPTTAAPASWWSGRASRSTPGT